MGLTPDFELTAGDTQPAITAQLTDAAGSVVVLTGASVRFRMRNVVTAAVAVDDQATVTNAATGAVSYAWQAGDTDVAADYAARWVVTWNAGGVTSYPSARDLLVRVKAGA